MNHELESNVKQYNRAALLRIKSCMDSPRSVPKHGGSVLDLSGLVKDHDLTSNDHVRDAIRVTNHPQSLSPRAFSFWKRLESTSTTSDSAPTRQLPEVTAGDVNDHMTQLSQGPLAEAFFFRRKSYSASVTPASDSCQASLSESPIPEREPLQR